METLSTKVEVHHLNIP